MKAAVLSLFPALAFGAVSGTVVNKTTNKPQANAAVTLYKLGEAGMESLETVKSGADGSFAITAQAPPPSLLQAAYAGVTYNHMLRPNAPVTGVEIAVYEATPKPGQARVNQHAVLLDPSRSELTVKEIYFYQNDGNTTWNDPEGGTLRFYLPEAAAGKATVMAQAPQGMPIRRPADPAGKPEVFKVDFPIKPGESSIEVNYRLPFQSPGKYGGRILQPVEITRLVTPNGVTLKGDGIANEGQEPRTKANIYSIKSKEFTVEIEGEALTATGAGDDEAGPSISQIYPRIHDRLPVVLGLALAILGLGFLLMYRADSGRGK